MNYTEFSQKVKAKYPGSYDDMDDRVLAQKMIQKFPQYSDVTFDEPIKQKPGIVDTVMGMVMPQIEQSPAGLLNKIPGTVSQVAGKLGERTAESLATEGFRPLFARESIPVSPEVAAGIGTGVAMAPDIVMSASAPLDTSRTAVQAAVPAARRALGFQKSFLKTPFARGQATKAAETALEEGVIPASGSPQAMFQRASELSTKAGRPIGEALKRTPANLQKAFDDLEALRPQLAQGMQGGLFEGANNAINKVQENIRELLDKSDEAINASKRFRVAVKTKNKVYIGKPGDSHGSISENIDFNKHEFIDDGFYDTIAKKYLTRQEAFDRVPFKSGVEQRKILKGIPAEYRKEIHSNDLWDLEKSGGATASDVNAIKNRLGQSINYLGDLASQIDNKAIQSTLANSIRDMVKGVLSPDEFIGFLNNQKLYNASQLMLKGLNNELAGQAGNMPVSLPSFVMGAGRGSIPQTVGALGGTEFLKRRGAGIAASEIQKAGKVLSTVGIASVPQAGKILKEKTLTKEKAVEFLDEANGDKVKARELAKAAGYKWTSSMK